MKVSVGDWWWRYENYRTAAYDPWAEFEQPVGSNPAMREIPFLVVALTPKGVWLLEYGQEWQRERVLERGTPKGWKQRWVAYEAHKKFACPSKRLAMESWLARKARQRLILKTRLREIDEAIRFAANKYPETQK